MEAGIEQAQFNAFESPVNNNPKDTKDCPQGVWTLPPTLALGDKDKDKYLAIVRRTLRGRVTLPQMPGEGLHGRIFNACYSRGELA